MTTNPTSQKFTPTPDNSANTPSNSPSFPENVYQTPWQNKAVLGSRQRLRMTRLPDGKGIRVEVLSQNIFNRFIYIFDKSSSSKFTVLKTEEFPEITPEKFQDEKTKLQELYKEHKSIEELLKQVENDLRTSDSAPTVTTSLTPKPAKPLPAIPAKPTTTKPAQPLTSEERAQRHAQIAELRQQLATLLKEISLEEASQQLQPYTQLNNSLKRMKEAATRSLNHLQELDLQADNPKTNSDALLQEASAIKQASEQGSRDLAAIRQTLTLETSLRESARNLTAKLAPFSVAIQKEWAAQLEKWQAQPPEQVSSIDQIKTRQMQLEGIIAATAAKCRDALLEDIKDARQQVNNTLGIAIPDTLSDQDRQAAVHALRKQAHTLRERQWEAMEREVATLGDDFNALSTWPQRIGDEKWVNVALIEILDKPPQQGLVEMLYAHAPSWRTLPGASMWFASMPDRLKKVAAFDEIVAYYLSKIPEGSKLKTNVVPFLLQCQHANMHAFVQESQELYPNAFSPNTHKAISHLATKLLDHTTPSISSDSNIAALQEEWLYDRQQFQHSLETFAILDQLALLYEKYTDLSRETERKIASATGHEKIAGNKALDQLKRTLEQYDTLEKMEAGQIDQRLLKSYKDTLEAAGTELGKIDDNENIKALKRAEIHQVIDDFATEIESYRDQVMEIEKAYGIQLKDAHAAIDQHKKEILTWKEKGYLPNQTIPSAWQNPLIYYSRAYLPESVVKLSAHAPESVVGELVDIEQLDHKTLSAYLQRVKTEIEIRKHALLHSSHLANLHKAHQAYQESVKAVQEKATAVHDHAASLVNDLDNSPSEETQADPSPATNKSPSTYEWYKHLVKKRQQSQKSLSALDHLEQITKLYERYSKLAKNAEGKVDALTGADKIAGQKALENFNFTIEQMGDFESLEIAHIDQTLVKVYKSQLEATATELDKIIGNEKLKVAKRAEIDKAIDEFTDELESYRNKVVEVETAYGIKLADAHATLDKHKTEMLKWKEEGYLPHSFIPSSMVYYSRAYLPESLFHLAASSEETMLIDGVEVAQLDIKMLPTYLQQARNEIEIRKNELQRSSYIPEVYKAHQECQTRMKAVANRATTLTSHSSLPNIEEGNLPKLQFLNADTLVKGLDKIKANQRQAGTRSPTAYRWYRQLTADDKACTNLVTKSEKTSDLSLLDQIRKLDHHPEKQNAAKLAFIKSIETRAQKHRTAVKKQLDNLKVHPDIHKCAENLIASAKIAIFAKERVPELQAHLAKLDPLLTTARTEPSMSAATLAQLSYKELQRYSTDIDSWMKTTESHLEELKITNDQANAASKLLQEKFDKAEALMDQLDHRDQLVPLAKLKKVYESMAEEKKILSDKEAQRKKRWLPDFSALFSLDTYLSRSPQGATLAALYEYKKNAGKAIGVLQAATDYAERQKTFTIPEQIAQSPDPQTEKELRTRFKDQVAAKIAASQKELENYRTAFGLGMMYIQPKTQLFNQIEHAIRKCTTQLNELKERYTTTFTTIDYFFGWLFKTKTPVNELSAAQMASYLHDVETSQKTFTTEIDNAFGLSSLLKHQANYTENTTTLAQAQINALCRQGNYLRAFELEMKIDEIKARKTAAWDHTISSADELKKLAQALKGYNKEIEAAIRSVKSTSLSSQRQIEELQAKRAGLTTPQAQRLETYFIKLRNQLAVEIETEQENHKNYLSQLRRDIRELCKEFRLPQTWSASADKAIALQEAKFIDAGKLPVNWAFGMLTSSKPIKEMKIDEIVTLKPEVVNHKAIKASLEEIAKVFNIDAIYKPYVEYKAALDSVRESKQHLIDDGQVKHAADMIAKVESAEADLKTYLKTQPIKMQGDLKPLGDKLKELTLVVKAAESAALTKLKLTPLEQLTRLPTGSPLTGDLRQLLEKDVRNQITTKRKIVEQHIADIEQLTISLGLPREWRDEIVGNLQNGLSVLDKEAGNLYAGPGWFASTMSLDQLKKIAEGIRAVTLVIDQTVSAYHLKSIKKEFSLYERLLSEAQTLIEQGPLNAIEEVTKLTSTVKQSLETAIKGPMPAAEFRARAKAAAEAQTAAEAKAANAKDAAEVAAQAAAAAKAAAAAASPAQVNAAHKAHVVAEAKAAVAKEAAAEAKAAAEQAAAQAVAAAEAEVTTAKENAAAQAKAAAATRNIAAEAADDLLNIETAVAKAQTAAALRANAKKAADAALRLRTIADEAADAQSYYDAEAAEAAAIQAAEKADAAEQIANAARLAAPGVLAYPDVIFRASATEEAAKATEEARAAAAVAKAKTIEAAAAAKTAAEAKTIAETKRVDAVKGVPGRSAYDLSIDFEVAEEAAKAAEAKVLAAEQIAAKAKAIANEKAYAATIATGAPSIIPHKMEELAEALHRCTANLQKGLSKIDRIKPPDFATLLRKYVGQPKYDEIRDALREDISKKLTELQTAIGDYQDILDKIDDKLEKLVNTKATRVWRAAVEAEIGKAQAEVSELMEGYPEGNTTTPYDEMEIEQLIAYEKHIREVIGTHKPGQERDSKSMLSQLESKTRLEAIQEELYGLERAFNGLSNCIKYMKADRNQANNKAALMAIDQANKKIIEEAAANLAYLRGGSYFCETLECTKATILRVYGEYPRVRSNQATFTFDPWSSAYKSNEDEKPPDPLVIKAIITEGYWVTYEVNDPNPRQISVQYHSIDNYIEQAEQRIVGKVGEVAKRGFEEDLNTFKTKLDPKDPSTKGRMAILDEALKEIAKFKNVLAELKKGMKGDIDKPREEITEFDDLLAYRNYAIAQICKYEEYIFNVISEFRDIREVYDTYPMRRVPQGIAAPAPAAAPPDDDDDDVDDK